MESLNLWTGMWAEFMLARVWESTLILAVVGIVWILIHKRVSAQFGYGLFFLPLIKLIVWIPVEYPVWMPQWHPMIVVSNTIPVFYTDSNQLPFPLPNPEISPERSTDMNTSAVTDSSLSRSEPNLSMSVDNFAPTQSLQFTAPTLSTIIFSIWIFIVAFLSVKYLSNQYRFHRILQDAITVKRDYESIDLYQLHRQAGVKQTVRFLASPSIKTPMVWGIRRPHLLLPTQFGSDFTTNQIRWVLLHELAHIRRKDLYAALFQRCVGILFFFHPAVWVTNRIINRLREYICDDMALAKSGISRMECGEGFLAIAERIKQTPAHADALLGFMREPSSVWRRMMRILDAERKLSVKVSLGAAVVLLLVAALVLPSVRAGETQKDSADPAGIVANTTATDTEGAKPENEKKPIIIRQVLKHPFPYTEITGFASDTSPSKDGRYLASVDWDTGNLVVKDLKTGEIRDLTQKGTWEQSNDFAEACSFAPDNQTIAYVWYDDKKSQHGIWIVNVDGSNKRVIYQEQSDRLEPILWGPNGKLYFLRSVPNEECQWVELSPSDQISRVIHRFPKGIAHRMSFSSDAQYIVWDQSSESNSKRDIYVYSIPEDRQVCLVQHPEDDILVGWSPNYKWIIFKSDRLGDWSLWGKPFTMDTAESAVMLKRGVDPANINFITPDGKYLSSEFQYQQSVFLAEIDFNNGKFITPPQQICSAPSITGVWSKNGKYFTINRETLPAVQPSVYSFENKTIRNYPTKYFAYFAGLWADNDRVLIGGGARTLTSEIVTCRLDIQTGEIQELFSPPTDLNVSVLEYTHHNNSPRLMAVMQKKGSNQIQVIYRDLTTGKNEEIYTGVAGEMTLYSIYLTNDRKWIYFMVKEGEEQVLKRFSMDNRELHEVFRTSKVADWRMTPDQQNIALLIREAYNQNALWNLHIESKEIRKILQFPQQVDHFDIHPDGKHLAYTEGDGKYVSWVMENFLPEEAMN